MKSLRSLTQLQRKGAVAILSRRLFALGYAVYALLRPWLFRLAPETSHDLTLGLLAILSRLQLDSLAPAPVADPVRCLGLTFPNRVGLAAGLDKDARAFEALGALGFGFLELGTVTPLAQPGNPKPRMFRLPEANALINRMGFNNQGLQPFLRRVQRRRYGGVLGINIGKNKNTPTERAADDYTQALQAVHRYADYVTVNLSSPNTPGLRDLQQGDALASLLQALDGTREALADREGRRVPLLLKVAPDLHDDDLRRLATQAAERGVDGLIACNTTLSRTAVAQLPHGEEAGGLSGAPAHERALEVVALLRAELGPAYPLIGVGGIDHPKRAQAMVAAGALLVQLYTGLIYQGPALVSQVARALAGSSS